MIPSNFAMIDGIRVTGNATGVAQAKLALNELKLKKKEFGIQKKLIVSRQKQICDIYTTDVRCVPW